MQSETPRGRAINFDRVSCARARRYDGHVGIGSVGARLLVAPEANSSSFGRVNPICRGPPQERTQPLRVKAGDFLAGGLHAEICILGRSRRYLAGAPVLAQAMNKNRR
jgi:hypothetical protein